MIKLLPPGNLPFCILSFKQCYSFIIFLFYQEVLHDIVTAEEGIQNHILHHISGMEHLKNTVQKATENLTGRLESMRSPLEEKIEDYKMAVDHLQSFGAKAATPTGKKIPYLLL